MRKFGVIILMSAAMILSIGCGGNQGVEYSRFKAIGDKYSISNLVYDAYYDSETGIVYLIDIRRGRGGATVMYNSEGRPMTLDEYKQ